MRKDTSLISC